MDIEVMWERCGDRMLLDSDDLEQALSEGIIEHIAAGRDHHAHALAQALVGIRRSRREAIRLLDAQESDS